MNQYEKEWLAEFEATEARAKSFKGQRLYADPVQREVQNNRFKFDLKKIRDLGGERLVKLYLCNSNFELAAVELNIKPATLRKHIAGIKKQCIKSGITENMLYNLLLKKDSAI